MVRTIPDGAETIQVPTLGTVVYFREGTNWLALWADLAERSPRATGATPGEAVANLVAGAE
jgi:hypothetical protein